MSNCPPAPIRRLGAALVGLCLWLGVAAGAAQAEGVFHPKVFTLDNGLMVVVIQNDRAPIVTHMVWYKVGAADEVQGKSGIAHFLEHLMFKGTDTVKPGEFSAIVGRIGGRENAFTTEDYTAYFQNVVGRPAGDGDEARGRPHGQSPPDRRRRSSPSARSCSRSGACAPTTARGSCSTSRRTPRSSRTAPMAGR